MKKLKTYKQPDLIKVKKNLSPRLKWMRKNQIILEKSKSRNRWEAAIIRRKFRWYVHSIDVMYDYFKSVSLFDPCQFIGIGETEEDALFDLCRKTGIKPWVELNPLKIFA